MRKIALITPMLQPYRLTFYEKLNRFHPDVEWIIFHGIKKNEDGRPAYAGDTIFKNVGLVASDFNIGPFIIRMHKGLFRELVRFDPDMVIIQSITGNLTYRRIVQWAHRNNKVIVNWACAWEPGFAKGVLLKFKNLLVSRFYKKGDFTLAYSTRACQYIKERGIEESRIEVCYNGIETDKLAQNENEILKNSELIKTKYNLSDSVTFLYVGGLLPEKQVDLLIDAFTMVRLQYPSLKLLIIGDGPQKEQIQHKIEQTEDNQILYLGRIIDGVDPYFAASTCLVLPGVGGLALNQAMFWNKICIVSEADGTEDDLVIDGKTGFRFNKNEVTSLANAMTKVIKLDKDQLKLMGEEARNIILTKSNVNHMVETFVSTIRTFYPELK